jgi:N-acylneuraminate cytidylyltransferase
MAYKTLGIITARGGSKSILQKNIYPVAGKPLIYYVIKAAKSAKSLNRLIVSTDDPQIANLAKKYGCEAPFLRPQNLAEDSTPDLPVFMHALSWLKKNENYKPDIIVHLRPTAPLLNSKDINRAIKLLKRNPKINSVRSVALPSHTPFKMFKINKRGYLKPILKKEFPEVFKKIKEPFNMPRQFLPKVWIYAGYVDALHYDTIIKQKSMTGAKSIPLFFENWRYIDIDSLRELKYVEMIIKSLKK